MTQIPLILRLKRQQHKKIAQAQDLIIQELYNVFNNAVLHGGTAIWRCYNGRRFSEDIDVYIPRDKKKIDLLFDRFQKRGFLLQKKKLKKNRLYSDLKYQRTLVRFEALFKTLQGELVDYETSDSNLITVYSLLPKNLIKEKVDAYLNRKKIRDLYDIFFLLKKTKINKVRNNLKKLIENYSEPVDEKDLKTIIITGLVPSSKKMIEYIKRKWEN